jgi:hypothetical protein
MINSLHHNSTEQGPFSDTCLICIIFWESLVPDRWIGLLVFLAGSVYLHTFL